MIILHGFEKKFGIIEPSPFVLKVHAYLHMANIDFEINTDFKNLKMAPKGKLPFISDGGKIVADSQCIIDHIKEKYGDKLDLHLSKEQKATAYLLTKSLDENFYFCLVYSRWLRDDTWPVVKQAFFGNLPPIIRHIVPALVRKGVSRSLYGQGISRHSDDEILNLTQSSLQALSDLLGEQKFMFGDKPTSFDATCYGFLAEYILVDIDNPFNSAAKEHSNLVEYCNRIKDLYF